MELYENNEPIQTQSTSLNSVLTSTFFRMFLGLIASAITAFYAYHSGMYIDIILNGYFKILAIAEVIVVLVFSLAFRKLSPTAVTVLFFAYAFLGTSALFAVLAYMGAKRDKDISNFGTILTVALLIGLILTVINIFLKNSMLDIVLDWAILFIFFGLTVYDTNKIKNIYESGAMDNEKLYVYGAMELYLDFINIFLRILSR